MNAAGQRIYWWTALVALASALVLFGGTARGARALEGPLAAPGTPQLTLTLDARTYALLTQKSGGSVPDTRTLTPIAPGAAGTTGGVFTFPVGRGNIDPTAFTGSASSTGGIRFESISQDVAQHQQSTVQFELRRFAVDLSTTPAELTATFLGQATYHSIPIASLDESSAHERTRAGEITISGVRLDLLAAGVQLFNQQAFNDQHHRFKVGEYVGTLTVTAPSSSA